LNVARATTLSLRALNRATLARQLLLTRQALTPVKAIERLAGLQAQVPRPPFVGLWSRLSSFARGDLVRAIERRDVVRATMMRATIHMVSRADYLAWRMPLQPMLSRALRGQFGRELAGVDLPALLEAAASVFETEPSTFASLRAHLKARFPHINERVMGYLVRLQLPLVMTPSPGAPWAYPANASFAAADGWLGEPPSRRESLNVLARRYLAAFGPATARDFQTWSGVLDARQVFDGLRDELVALRTDDGRELFDLPRAPRPGDDADAPVRFLPEYDNLLLAYADRRRVIDPAHKAHLITRNLMIPAAFLVDGMVAGLWRVEAAGTDVRLQITPFGPLDRRTRQALEAEGASLLAFLAPDLGAAKITFAGGRSKR
jgi:hypothetical protein